MPTQVTHYPWGMFVRESLQFKIEFADGLSKEVGHAGSERPLDLQHFVDTPGLP